MLKVNIYFVKDNGKAETVTILGWDEKKQEVVILKGGGPNDDILTAKFLDRRTRKYISAADGKSFIENLEYALAGSRYFAGKAYED